MLPGVARAPEKGTLFHFFPFIRKEYILAFTDMISVEHIYIF